MPRLFFLIGLQYYVGRPDCGCRLHLALEVGPQLCVANVQYSGVEQLMVVSKGVAS